MRHGATPRGRDVHAWLFLLLEDRDALPDFADTLASGVAQVL
ncbi:hypothetical protein [Nonomuraea lactucae]|nr:hypothetical protein [Nonomuraea lactucae]